MNLTNPWLLIAALSSFLAIVAETYGAHALSNDAYSKNAFDTASHFHMWHSLALLSIAWFCESRPKTNNGQLQEKWGHRAGCLFILGILLFCGSLYSIGLNITLPINGLAPTGGIMLMAGWLTLAFAASR